MIKKPGCMYASLTPIPTGVQETYELENMVYSTVPEPGTLLLLGAGLFGLAVFLRKRSK